MARALTVVAVAVAIAVAGCTPDEPAPTDTSTPVAATPTAPATPTPTPTPDPPTAQDVADTVDRLLDAVHGIESGTTDAPGVRRLINRWVVPDSDAAQTFVGTLELQFIPEFHHTGSATTVALADLDRSADGTFAVPLCIAEEISTADPDDDEAIPFYYEHPVTGTIADDGTWQLTRLVPIPDPGDPPPVLDYCGPPDLVATALARWDEFASATVEFHDAPNDRDATTMLADLVLPRNRDAIMADAARVDFRGSWRDVRLDRMTPSEIGLVWCQDAIPARRAGGTAIAPQVRSVAFERRDTSWLVLTTNSFDTTFEDPFIASTWEQCHADES